MASFWQTAQLTWTRSHDPPWECRPGRSTSSSADRRRSEKGRRGASKTTFPRGSRGTSKTLRPIGGGIPRGVSAIGFVLADVSTVPAIGFVLANGSTVPAIGFVLANGSTVPAIGFVLAESVGWVSTQLWVAKEPLIPHPAYENFHPAFERRRRRTQQNAAAPIPSVKNADGSGAVVGAAFRFRRKY